ncbi:MAG: copper-binding protein [Candidatus Methylomirabilales bacterium]
MGVWLLALGQAFGVTFTGVGTVLSLVPSAEVIVLDHEAIEACMPPMKMGFYVASVDLLTGLKRGDRVEFTFTIDGPRIVITEITKI